MKPITDLSNIYRSPLSREAKLTALHKVIDQHFTDPLTWQDSEIIEDAVFTHYRIQYEGLIDLSKRGSHSDARQMLYYILNFYKGYNQLEIAERYRVNQGAVSRGIRTVKDCILLQAKEADDLEAIRKLLTA